MIKDDDYLRKQLDKEEYELYLKVCDESWRPLPKTYEKHGKKRWAYKEER